MKPLVFFAVLFVGPLAERITDGSGKSYEAEVMRGCIISEGLLSHSETIGDILQKDQYTIDNENFNKFFGCYYKTRGLIDRDGNLQLDNIKTFYQTVLANDDEVKQMHKLLAQKAVDECKNTQGDNYRQKAVKMQNCVLGFLKQVADD